MLGAELEGGAQAEQGHRLVCAAGACGSDVTVLIGQRDGTGPGALAEVHEAASGNMARRAGRKASEAPERS
ncbi:hypothetical protein GCM10020229_72180 [Kitasatospora albolonga]